MIKEQGGLNELGIEKECCIQTVVVFQKEICSNERKVERSVMNVVHGLPYTEAVELDVPTMFNP